MKSADYWIRKLGLKGHPEGGLYRETYRAAGKIPKPGLPEKFAGPRSYSTAIYFLLKGGQRSVFHRHRSDELWHFYYGSPLILYVIDGKGRLARKKLGDRPERGESFQALAKGGFWMAAEVANPKGYSLVGCTVAPGFAFGDFELAERRELFRRYPRHRALIRKMSR